MKRAKFLTPILFWFLLTGCSAPLVIFGAGTAAGVGGYKFYKGSLTVLYQAPFMEVWDGTLKAVEEMNLKIELSEHDITSGRIHAKRADKKTVAIVLKYKSQKETEAVIRVGFFGDEGASIVIKDRIKQTLFGE